MNRALHILCACAVVTTALAGCARPMPTSYPVPAAQSPAPTHVDPGQTTQPIGGLTEMPAEQKTAQISSAFVTEWPVVVGKVLGANAPNKRELHYALEVAAPASTVEQWYRATMGGREFVLTREAKTSTGGVVLTYFRAGMTYVIEIEPDGESVSRVRATLKLNAPVKP